MNHTLIHHPKQLLSRAHITKFNEEKEMFDDCVTFYKLF